MTERTADEQVAFADWLAERTTQWLEAREAGTLFRSEASVPLLEEAEATAGARWRVQMGNVRVRGPDGSHSPADRVCLIGTQTLVLRQDDGTVLDVREFDVLLGTLPTELPPRAWREVPREAFEALVADLEHRAAAHLPDAIVPSFSFLALVTCWMRDGLPAEQALVMRPVPETFREMTEAEIEEYASRYERSFSHGFAVGRYRLLLNTEHTQLWLADDSLESAMWQLVWLSDDQAGLYKTIDGQPQNARALSEWLRNAIRVQGIDRVIGSDPDEVDEEDEDFDWEQPGYFGPLSEWLRFQHRGMLIVDRRVQGEVVQPGGLPRAVDDPSEPSGFRIELAPPDGTPQLYADFLRELVLP